jgi:MYXO-CTERM domain-containing protein
MMQRSVALLVAVALLLLPRIAHANSSGVAGYTGKPNGVAPNGQTCGSCHTGGSTPTVTLTGPDTLAAGASAELTLSVQGDGSTAGAAAGSDGATLTPGAGFRDSFGEMVQTGPQGANGTFKFTVKAPLNGTTMKIWAVGLGGSALESSASKAITKDIAITGGGAGSNDPNAPGGTPGAGGGDDSNEATPGSSTGTTPGSPSSSKKTTKKSSDDDDDDDNSDYRERRDQLNDAQACAASVAGRPGSSTAAFGLMLVLAAVVARRRQT